MYAIPVIEVPIPGGFLPPASPDPTLLGREQVPLHETKYVSHREDSEKGALVLGEFELKFSWCDSQLSTLLRLTVASLVVVLLSGSWVKKLLLFS